MFTLKKKVYTTGEKPAQRIESVILLGTRQNSQEFLKVALLILLVINIKLNITD